MDLDEQEFQLLIKRFQLPVFNLVLRMTGSQEIARDLSQDVFMRAWLNRDTLMAQRNTFTLLYRMAVQRSIDYLRKIKPVEVEDDVRDEVLYAQIEEDDLYHIILRCAGRLQPKQKAVFILRDMEGLTFEEISGITGQTAGQIHSNLHLARRNIRRTLENVYHITRDILYEL
jgi:RNA polymerase sigma-70 factor (ECF subfamily)